jgi:hypothetical protein
LLSCPCRFFLSRRTLEMSFCLLETFSLDMILPPRSSSLPRDNPMLNMEV